MKRFRMMISLFVLAGAALLLASSAFAAPAKPDGKAIFNEQHCSMCHGPDGKGFAAIHTPDFTDPKWQASKTDKQLLDAIKNGVKGTAMMPFEGKLSDAEIHALVDYVRSLNPAKKGKAEAKK
jgi:cbb3-type cytochrome c oxidase subunit III